MAFSVTLSGIVETSAALARLESSAASASKRAVYVGSALAYARFIETGQSSRQRRRAGGAWMLTHALESLAPSIPAAVARALPHGGDAVYGALTALGHEVESRAKAQTPVRSGALRASIHVSDRVA